MLLNTLQCTGQPPQQERIAWSQMPIELRLRKPQRDSFTVLKKYLQFHVFVTGQCLETKIPKGDGTEKKRVFILHIQQFHIF